ncbi:hypothetical protein BJY52DRAFT_1372194 [Lactarius psammicola]|nr:hypothetical protein BJY52DRAFT_1372194 [Lactarius psammicola]
MPPVPLLEHSHLTILDIIGSPDEEEPEVQDQVIAVADDDPITLQDGQEYLFPYSVPDQEDSRTEIEILKALETLDYHEHTVFSLGMEDIQSDVGQDDYPDALTCHCDNNVIDVTVNSDVGDDGDSASEHCYGKDEGEEGLGSDDPAWAPHGSKAECGAHNVPSFKALRRKQRQLNSEGSLSPQHHVSPFGNNFYMNHPSQLFALDFSNPLVCPHITLYPEVGGGPISEFWDAQKWSGITSDEYDDQVIWADFQNASFRHFYVRELAQLSDGSFMIPIRWVTICGVPSFAGYQVQYYRQSREFCVLRTLPLVWSSATQLAYNIKDLQDLGPITFIGPDASEWTDCIKHPVRKIANGCPVFTVRAIVWADDVSGNRTKQYNAHLNVYIASANLPHRLRSQEYFVRFCSTSPVAGSAEQFVALEKDLQRGKYHPAYHSELGHTILFNIISYILPADNPQQALNCSHGGLKMNYFCCYDMAGGTAKEKETDERYHALFSPDCPREVEDTVSHIWSQIQTACLGVESAVIELQAKTGVKDRIAQYWIEKLIPMARERQKDQLSPEKLGNLRGEERVAMREKIKGDICGQLLAWVVQQPPHRYKDLPETLKDSPFELLHSYQLGHDKYIWYETTKGWDKKKDELFAARLQSVSVSGLNIPSLRPRYIVQYKNSLFRPGDGLCNTDVLFDLWKAIGELGARLWYPEIKNMEEYIADIKVLVANVLDVWSVFDAFRIVHKYKLHVLVHIVDDIIHFGPVLLYSTEIFECWNAIFRLCSIYSNHMSPSRDIATTLAQMERFRHQASGGWWKDKKGEWICAGSKIRHFFLSNSQIRQRFGYRENLDASQLAAGFSEDEPWVLPSHLDLLHPKSESWVRCKYVVLRTGDKCEERSWVFFRSGGEVCTFCITSKILASVGNRPTEREPRNIVVLIEHFNILNLPDQRLNMLILQRSRLAQYFVKPEEILFDFNAQHDCTTFNCPVVQTSQVRQERILTDIAQAEVKHIDDSRFHLNMHSLHNPHLIHSVLPQELTRPKPYFSDRHQEHMQLAAQLRVRGPAKRAEGAAKRQATKARNRAEVAARGTNDQKRGRADTNPM